MKKGNKQVSKSNSNFAWPQQNRKAKEGNSTLWKNCWGTESWHKALRSHLKDPLSKANFTMMLQVVEKFKTFCLRDFLTSNINLIPCCFHLRLKVRTKSKELKKQLGQVLSSIKIWKRRGTTKFLKHCHNYWFENSTLC